VAQLNSFDPFGKVNSSQNLNSFGGQSYGFTGLEHDESGLVYARNRYYSPALGRFISEDPIGFGGGSNFYAYCGNDPINFTDPLGLMAMGLYDGGGVWFGGTADSPALAFGGPTRTPAASYRCPRAEVDESSPAFDGGFVSMRSQHEGMDGKSARSRWAYHAIEKVRDQYCGAAFSFATAGLGMMAVETAEGMMAAKGVVAAEEGANAAVYARNIGKPDMHVVVEVAHEGKTAVTHLMPNGTGGSSVLGSIGPANEFGAMSEFMDATYFFNLSNSLSAFEFSSLSIGANSGAYSLAHNSCITYAGRVLSAGGMDINMRNSLSIWKSISGR
jgi:RHS repeat-associated protein